MRTFTELRQTLDLQKYLDSPVGTLYFVPFSHGAPRIIVRHFDREVPPSLSKAFGDVTNAAQGWIERHPSLLHLVTVVQPIEVGADFVMRPQHAYSTSTDAYTEWDDPPKPPVELEKMRNVFRAAVGQSIDARDKVVETVLRRSLLEPTGKTYFEEPDSDDECGRFIVVEPKFMKEDLIAWTATYWRS